MMVRSTQNRWYKVMKKSSTTLKLNAPASYQIKVQGYLDSHWANRLSGLSISLEEKRSHKDAITTLTGPLADQAALFGVLNTLYDLRLPLISVQYQPITQIENNHENF